VKRGGMSSTPSRKSASSMLSMVFLVTVELLLPLNGSGKVLFMLEQTVHTPVDVGTLYVLNNEERCELQGRRGR